MELARRNQRNLGIFLGLEDGLDCEVKVIVVDEEGSIAPSEKHVTYKVTADLGSKTPGSAVLRARAEVGRKCVRCLRLRGHLSGSNPRPPESVDASPNEYPGNSRGRPCSGVEATIPDSTIIGGCSAEPSQVIGATVQLNGPAKSDLGAELKQDTDGIKAKEDRLERLLQRVLDSLDNVVFNCPAAFEFTVNIDSTENRRSLLSGKIQDPLLRGRALAGIIRRLLQTDAGRLTIDMGDDASSNEVSAARAAVRDANFENAITDYEINGKKFNVMVNVDADVSDESSEDDAGNVSDGHSEDDARILGPAISISSGTEEGKQG